ncbi:type III secretion system export apparatus subunit SctT [Vibrio sp. TBV020]|uniref:type III secretion system export apparatus subunit SctT n=1 Tax=Vibrio sp. TBV020 TaxID=3137398 RepID=UPI0038CD1D1B
MIGFNDILIIFSLCIPRLIGAMLLIPVFSKKLLGGTTIRNSLAACLALPLLPYVINVYDEINSGFILIAIILKEIFIGLLIGFITAIPFQAMESMGCLIDNQRGAAMAIDYNPFSSEQTSPLGVLFNQVSITIFFSFGFFLIWLGAMYHSFLLWPIVQVSIYLPDISIINLYQLLEYILEIALRLAAPAIIIMFLAEFGLGLMNRFVPQMNVFILAMPIKSGIAILILLLYINLSFKIFIGEMLVFIEFTDWLHRFIG